MGTKNRGGEFHKSSGQAAVEYILLLVVGVTIWMLVVKGLVSRSPQSPGVVVQKWMQLVRVIGTDRIE